MDRYEAALKSLNREQREAVETIDGPVMVIAGPGTGKTQLIGTRVGYILQNTDTPADAVLLLTFTEAGVQAMRERLNRLIGKAAYDVQLSTYHAFGGEIFRRYPEYFEGAELTLIEDLGSDSLLREIIAKLPYSNPLKFADSYIGDIKSFISESKRALLSHEDIDDIADSNIKFINAVNKACKPLLGRLSTVSKKSVPVFEEMLTFLSSSGNGNLPHNVTSLGRYAQGELEVAIEHFNQTGKTSQLTEWKRRWMAKDSEGNSIIDGERLNRRLKAGAAIYRQYQKSLKERRQYDYDDMILRAIGLLETNPDLRFSLAERYSYIMLDEFQDTNPAQFRLVELLTDHPVHEGRPNVLAVGDDDQAIYAFQGADHANMATFIRHYRDVKVISLKDNYRSHQELIDTGRNIAEQIQSRLHRQLPVIEKRLVAAGKEFPEKLLIAMRQFKSDAAQYEWVAQEISNLIKQGAEPNGIAVLAPKHRYLEPLLPYLASRNIPVSYERRENILDEPLVHQLEQMSRLVLALAESREPLANSLWLEVLSYDFWNIPTEKIWSIGWQSRQTGEPWTSIILNDETLGGIGEFFLRLARLLPTTSLEQQLDALIGLPDAADLNLAITSPMYGHYFSKEEAGADPINFSRLISELNILRSRLAGWRAGQDGPQGLRAFVEFVEGHRAAGINILNTSPYFAAADSVSLLTAYGAKGREFQTVFIVAALDEAWGSTSRNQGYRLSLPANLEYIRYQGASEDERLRLLYVAATRARTRLYITAYRQDLAGRSLTNLKYLEIEEDEQGKLFARVLPARFSQVALDESDAISHQAAADYWSRRHLPPLKAPLKDLLAPRLQNYRLSATDLNNFIDIIHHGPEDFFMRCLMRFPKAPSVGEAFGTSLHNTLRFAGRDFVSNGRLPVEKQLLETFDAQLSRIDLPDEETGNLRRRGHDSLRAWLVQRGVDLKAGDRFEYSFQNEHPTVEGVRLNGIIDRLSVDEKRRTLYITDYKTGRAYHRWQSGVIKLHLFQQQLIIYKLLVENSERYKNYRVERAAIEFVEPDDTGRIVRLEMEYDAEQVNRTIELAKSIWQSIMSLELPDISGYQATFAGVKKFEDDLIKKRAGR